MAVFTVSTGRDTVDAGDGALSLREAVAAAERSAGADTVRFAPFLEGSTMVLTGGELTLRGGVTLDGDVDGDGTGVVLGGGGTDRVLSVAGPGAVVRLEGLGITQGSVTDENGGGVLVGAGARLTLDGCTVRDNIARVDQADGAAGGAIFAGDGSQVTVLASDLSGNFAYGAGGGIATGANVRLSLVDSTLRANSGYTVGGAVAVERGSHLLVEGTDVSGNQAGNFYGGAGGGLSIRGAAAVIRESSLGGNNARQYGGGLEVRSGSVLVEDSSIAGNTVRARLGGDGGGISARGGSELRLVDSTVTGNFASYYSSFGPVLVGGGIYSTGGLELANTIVAGNSSGPSPQAGPDRLADDIEGQITRSNGHNLFGQPVAGDIPGDRENVDPARIFAGIDPATGGGMLALASGTGTAAVALRDGVGNPALGGADPLSAGTRDQQGDLRPQPRNGRPDIGASELGETSLSLRASDGNDVLVGTGGADVLAGRFGNDLLRGQGGNDTLSGEGGSDLLEGAAGDDVMRGGGGVDALSGSSGQDQLFGEAGNDRLAGGADGDRLAGGDGDDELTGGPGDDAILGEVGARDRASWSRDGGPADVGVTVDLALGTARRGGEVDTLTGIEELRGTEAVDDLAGNDGANVLLGMGEADRLAGRGGDDVLDGGTGGDLLDGGAGAADLVAFGPAAAAVTVDLAAGRATQAGEIDRLTGIEGAVGTGFADDLRGGAGSNVLRGGDDADRLYGGLGRDTLSGGTGPDRFVYAAVAESPSLAAGDLVLDFSSSGEGFIDRLDFAAIDARSATAGVNDAFTFIDTAAFTAAGQVRWRSLADGSVVEANTGGNLAPDLTIELRDTFVFDADSVVL